MAEDDNNDQEHIQEALRIWEEEREGLEAKGVTEEELDFIEQVIYSSLNSFDWHLLTKEQRASRLFNEIQNASEFHRNLAVITEDTYDPFSREVVHNVSRQTVREHKPKGFLRKAILGFLDAADRAGVTISALSAIAVFFTPHVDKEGGQTVTTTIGGAEGVSVAVEPAVTAAATGNTLPLIGFFVGLVMVIFSVLTTAYMKADDVDHKGQQEESK